MDFQEVSKAHSSGAPVFFVNARASSPRGFDAVESRELLLMIGKSINTASARMQGKAIGA